MRLLPILSAGLILASCNADQPASTASNEGLELDGECVATPADFERLRETFRETAAMAAKKTTDHKVSFDDGKRPPLTHPFADPPKVRFGVSQNPFRIDYGWSVKLTKACRYSEAKPGFFLNSVDLDIRFNKNHRIIDDRIHFKIDNK